MKNKIKSWQKLFLFCLGLFAGTAFCMKWMENDFLVKGEKFTIIGLEISYSKAKIAEIFSAIDMHVKAILKYHLAFDFAFMAGVYPGIASLNMIAYQKTSNKTLQKILLGFAFFQLIAWGCDIIENCYLLNWLEVPSGINHFELYHSVVFAKWIIALSGAILAIPLALRRNKA
jgi:hypothetical protein